MTKIHVLSQALSNQIAAGEVLERSASAVKELVENSLDAGATAIEIEIDDGGKKHLMVSDNGCGMTREDVQLSILRHATSKIHTSSDLASISTMGFRGEALASMAAVSRMTITTQRPEDEMGTFLRVEGTEVLECRDTAAPAGTQIVLDDLFFNTPARLKFLKTTATEVRRVYEVVEQFGLACPEVSWKLTVDGR
ncbi:MAG: ATP-binding protein, partial [Proteobacteria bacterium]|nr:ATP-binding protein [Pseudomonadota bacterium]